VGLGSVVVVLDVDKDEKVRYKLVTSEDVDCFVIEAKQGQRISAEVEGIRRRLDA